MAHSKGMLVEAELGRLSGTEDGLTVEEYEARFTDVAQVISYFPSNIHSIGLFFYTCVIFYFMVHIFQALEFIDETGIDSLAVCIGNVHGKYPPSGPNLRFDLLEVRQMRLNFPSVFGLWKQEIFNGETIV